MHHMRHDGVGEEIREQLASLSQEVARLRKQMMQRGSGAARETRHMGEETAEMLREYAASALPEIRRSAHQIQRSARDNPATTASIAAAGVIVIGLAAALLMRR